MLEWLKTILGEGYTDEIDEKISKEIGKAFVSRKDFNEKVKLIGEHEKTIQNQTTELDNLRSSNTDAAALQQQLSEKDAAHAAEINALKVDFHSNEIMAQNKKGRAAKLAALGLLLLFESEHFEFCKDGFDPLNDLTEEGDEASRCKTVV